MSTISAQLSAKTLLLVVDELGGVAFLYDDELAPLLDEGAANVQRASHVEPALQGRGWTADMAPSGGPVLGPFPTRGEALRAEVDWLQARM